MLSRPVRCRRHSERRQPHSTRKHGANDTTAKDESKAHNQQRGPDTSLTIVQSPQDEANSLRPTPSSSDTATRKTFAGREIPAAELAFLALPDDGIAAKPSI
jgi:hypothetical protein